MKTIFTIIISTILFSSCNTHIAKNSLNDESIQNIGLDHLIHKKELKIFAKFDTPLNYTRKQNLTDFGRWLNNISLKNDNVPVYTYNGQAKPNPNIYVGVLDLEQPTKNVQFNENGVISLRAEYFFQAKKYDKLDALAKIPTNPIPYTKYINGDYSYKKFKEYLTYYLENSNPSTIKYLLEPIPFKDLQIGDVLFQKGATKSHAVIVMDTSTDNKGNKLYILAQTYYPSQDIQIITNPSNDYISPWYEAAEGIILTPEWRFLSSDLMRFK